MVLLSLLLMLAPPDAVEVMKQMIEADRANGVLSNQYTYVEHADHFSFDKSGTAKKDRSETFDVIFVEGSTYKRLIARNDQPLSAKEEAREKKNLEAAAATRRKEHSTLTHKVVSIGGNDELLTLFENRLVGEEEVRGHKAWVIVSTPKPGQEPANDHEKDVLSFEKKMWIDQEEHQVLRTLSTVVGKHIVLMPGSTVQFDFEKVNGEAWLQTSGLLDGHLQFAKMIKPRVRTEYTYSKYQKFDVKSTIRVEPAK
jgi:hypothetical protein